MGVSGHNKPSVGEGELDASVDACKHTELREVHGSAQGREWWQESRPCVWVGGCGWVGGWVVWVVGPAAQRLRSALHNGLTLGLTVPAVAQRPV
jgi:hypothetical protein